MTTLTNAHELSDRIYRIIGVLFAFPEERQQTLSLFEGKGRFKRGATNNRKIRERAAPTTD
jgi:hypothetical protein